jgi:hypothetical protein
VTEKRQDKANGSGCYSLIQSDLRRTRAELRRETNPIFGRWLGIVASESEWRKPLHSARISRPRRSADRGSPGDALTVEDWETLVEEDGWVRDSARTETFPLSRTRD